MRLAIMPTAGFRFAETVSIACHWKTVYTTASQNGVAVGRKLGRSGPSEGGACPKLGGDAVPSGRLCECPLGDDIGGHAHPAVKEPGRSEKSRRGWDETTS